MRFQVVTGPIIRETVVVDEGPIRTDFEAMNREWVLDTIRSMRTRFHEDFVKLPDKSPSVRRKHRHVMRRFDKAVEMLRGQLAVWKVHDQ